MNDFVNLIKDEVIKSPFYYSQGCQYRDWRLLFY